MSNEAIEEEYWRGRDQHGDEPCAVCKGSCDGEVDGCSACEYSGLEGVRLWGSPPGEDDDEDESG